MREITVKEFLDALDKNGYPWTKSWGFYEGKSCALGQVIRNLGYDPINYTIEIPADRTKKTTLFIETGDLVEVLNEVNGQLVKEYGADVIWYNDTDAKSYQDVVEYVHARLDSYLGNIISFDDNVISGRVSK